MPALATELLKFGAPGIAFLVLLWVIKTLWEDNKAVREEMKLLQQKRVDDANTVADKLIATTRDVSVALNQSTAAQNANRDSLRDFERALDAQIHLNNHR